MLPMARPDEIYAMVGDSGFRALVDDFYQRVEADEALRAVFPPDLTEGKEHQYLFLRQYFGGPDEYSSKYGHPMLRRRHFPFAIDRAARDAWLAHMLAAIDAVPIPEPAAGVMRAYFTEFSLAMINR